MLYFIARAFTHLFCTTTKIQTTQMPMRKWRVEDSAELYNIAGWGREFVSFKA
jgi:arginine decarboxylase-like protein